MRDIIEEFNKLKQEGLVQAYQLKFEELRSLVMVHNPHLFKEYFVSSFISSLGDEVKPMVNMIQPQTMKQAAESARLQEMIIEALTKKQRNQTRGVITGGWQVGNRLVASNMGHQGKGVLALPSATLAVTSGRKLIE